MINTQRFAAPASIFVISFLLTHSNEAIDHFFRYDRNAIFNGEIWRVLTGNFTHANTSHWAINMLGLGVLWYLYKPLRKRYELLLIIIIAAMGTCIGLLLFEPQLKWYVGLSGALHGVFAAGIILSLKSEPKFQILLAFLLFFKLVYEQFMGPLPGTGEIAKFPVIVNSHLYGAITGIITGIFLFSYDLYKIKLKS